MLCVRSLTVKTGMKLTALRVAVAMSFSSFLVDFRDRRGLPLGGPAFSPIQGTCQPSSGEVVRGHVMETKGLAVAQALDLPGGRSRMDADSRTGCRFIDGISFGWVRVGPRPPSAGPGAPFILNSK